MRPLTPLGIGLFLFLLIVTGPVSEARPPIRADFFTLYPGAENTQLDELPSDSKHCGVCHIDFSGAGQRNPYGVAMEALIQLGLSNTDAMIAIETEDTDGDGISNIVEVTNVLFNNTPTFPGLSTANAGAITAIPLNEVTPYLTPSGSADATPPAVTLSQPDGGEVLAAGNFYPAVYTATDANGISHINVYLSTDGGASFKQLMRGEAPAGSVQVFVPNLPTIQGILRLEAVDHAGNPGSDDSNAPFTVTALPGLAPTTLADMTLPGTQPFEGAVLEDPTDHCASCHGGYDPANEPWETWRGSMMGQAMRDPLFLACVTIAEQDAPGVGDLCIRCHSPGGWQEGRSIDTSGGLLNAKDFQGIQCDFCHRLVSHEYVAGVSPARDLDVLSGVSPLPLQFGNGQFVNDPSPQYRGPFDTIDANHQYLESPLHRSSDQCGICHDVSNPVFLKTGPADYALTAFDQEHPTMNVRDMFPIERTFSEWSVSEYATTGVFAPQFAGNKPDGIVSSCQDCHMRDVNAKGCNQGGISARPDMPMHDLMGGNTFIPDVLAALYPGDVDAVALQSARQRAVDMLQLAATLELEAEEYGVEVKVTNETGHKLPSGYPEGRRIWLNVVARDSAGVPIYESGAYDTVTGLLTHDNQVKIYKIEPGLSPALAGGLSLPSGKSFHFVLNDTVYSDNRIPPRGFTNAAFETIQSPPVAYAYADSQYWDETEYMLPPDSDSVTVTLYYQTTTKEYVEFLRDENTTNSTGQTLYNAWLASGKAAPIAMASQTIEVDVTASTSVAEEFPPQFAFGMRPGWPNPFASRTRLGYSIPARAHVSLRVFDVTGRLVRTLVDGIQGPDEYEIEWDGRDDRGVKAAAGVYFVRLQAGGNAMNRNLVVTR